MYFYDIHQRRDDDGSQNRDRQIRKPRPSVRAQLAQDKKRTAPKKTAAKTKNHGLEV